MAHKSAAAETPWGVGRTREAVLQNLLFLK